MMGKSIDLNKPLTQDEREYLESRRRIGDIAANDRRFGHLSDSDKSSARKQVDSDNAEDDAEQEAIRQNEEEADVYDDDLVDQVLPLKTADLRSQLGKLGLETGGKKDDLRMRLLEHLQNERDEDES